MLNLATILDDSARTFSDKTAVVCAGKRITYTQLNAAANRLANALSETGIGKGDKVALSCLNLPYFPMVYYGILKTGAVVVPLNVLLKGREIAYHLSDSDAKAYFCFQGAPELPMAQEGWFGFNDVDTCEHFWVITADPEVASPIEGVSTMEELIGRQSSLFDTVNTECDDTAVILYTSGTTGYPKGAELSHANMIFNALGARDLEQLNDEDIHLIALPLFHSFGQTGQMNAGFSKGNTLVLIPKFHPKEVLSTMQEEKVTVFAGVPTMYWALLTYEDEGNQLDINTISTNLRLGISGASSLPFDILNGIQEKYNIPILEGYGLSETSPVVTFNHLNKARKVGSVGTPMWGVEVRIVDSKDQQLPAGQVGEILVHGHNVMKGYYKKPEATADTVKGDGWLYTGDLGRLDEDGYLYIVDRLKDMIIRGGFNIYPREIEEVLMTHPDISLAAVIGVPHDSRGEEVKAFIVLKEGVELSETDIVSWSKENLASHKYPRIVEIRDTLPLTATGKILKKLLK